MGFSRQNHWGGLPCPLQGIFPTKGLNPLVPPGKPILAQTAVKSSYSLGELNNRHLLLIVLEAGTSQIKALVDSVSGETSLLSL